MKASLIIIGDEILLGEVADTNSGNIARMLTPMGWEIVSTHVVGDNEDVIPDAIDYAMRTSQLVITTGGLGPTKDDITMHTLLRYFGGKLIYDEEVEANIKRVFKRRGLELNQSTRNQALVPNTCRVIQNELGTAPIMWFERDGSVLISMPGVPFETVGMMQRAVLDQIKRRFNAHDVFSHRSLILSGVTESALSEHLSDWESKLPRGMHLAYLPSPGYLRLRFDGVNVNERVFDREFDALRRLVSGTLLYDGDATPAEILLSRLQARHLTVASAESCTGGNIAHLITSVPGSSECFYGSVVSYDNSVKTNVLGVNPGDIGQYGAVSEQVVRQMAEGAKRVIGTKCSIATSGIAGPGGGTQDKPVGSVWIAASIDDRTVARLYHFPGSRERVIQRASTEAIILLVRFLDACFGSPYAKM